MRPGEQHKPIEALDRLQRREGGQDGQVDEGVPLQALVHLPRGRWTAGPLTQEVAVKAFQRKKTKKTKQTGKNAHPISFWGDPKSKYEFVSFFETFDSKRCENLVEKKILIF